MIKFLKNQNGIYSLDTKLYYSKYRNEIEPMLDGPSELSVNMLKANNWAAILVPDGINEQDSIYIASAAQEINCSKCIALTTEEGSFNEIVEVDMIPKGLVNFHLNCRLSYYILFPEDKKFVILDEADFYYIIAGPRSFVEKAVGGSIKKARKDFLEYANDPNWPERTRQFLTAIAKKYEPFNGK